MPAPAIKATAALTEAHNFAAYAVEVADAIRVVLRRIRMEPNYCLACVPSPEIVLRAGWTSSRSGSENWLVEMEAAMREYEIRVLTNGRTSAVYEVVHLSDHAAIRAAKSFAGGLPFEVWRGLDCIYGGVTRMPDLPTDRPRP
jgi:hypothetical protein